MNRTEILLGKILGEIYRLQKHTKTPCEVGAGQLYGLLSGFEYCIEEELESIGFISKEKLEAVGVILDEIFLDKEKTEKFKGFYDIEPKMKQAGVQRWEAMKILKYYNADNKFSEIIKKMDSINSPVECKTFELYDDEK